MKKEDLQALGLSDEQIEKVHALNGVDVNAEKAKTDKALKDADAFKNQLNETQEALKKFDGVDVDAYKTQISELNTQLETQKQTYETEKSEREYNEWLSKGLETTKVKSIKALQAELGDKLSVLKESKNRDEDLKKILEENKETYAWMVESEEPIKNPVHESSGGGSQGGATDAARAVMGLPPMAK